MELHLVEAVGDERHGVALVVEVVQHLLRVGHQGVEGRRDAQVLVAHVHRQRFIVDAGRFEQPDKTLVAQGLPADDAVAIFGPEFLVDLPKSTVIGVEIRIVVRHAESGEKFALGGFLVAADVPEGVVQVEK